MLRSRRFAAPSSVFAHQKGLLHLKIRTIGLARAPREDRARQPCLQHAALHLAADKMRGQLVVRKSK